MGENMFDCNLKYWYKLIMDYENILKDNLSDLFLSFSKVGKELHTYLQNYYSKDAINYTLLLNNFAIFKDSRAVILSINDLHNITLPADFIDMIGSIEKVLIKMIQKVEMNCRFRDSSVQLMNEANDYMTQQYGVLLKRGLITLDLSQGELEKN